MLTPNSASYAHASQQHTLHSKADPSAHTAPARAKFLERFEAGSRS